MRTACSAVHSGLCMQSTGPRTRQVRIYPYEKDAALALNASALEEALQTLRAAFVSAGYSIIIIDFSTCNVLCIVTTCTNITPSRKKGPISATKLESSDLLALLN